MVDYDLTLKETTTTTGSATSGATPAKKAENNTIPLSHTEEINSDTFTSSSSTTEYTVQKGDTLAKIAKKFGVNVNALYEANKETIGSNMNLIQVGMKLKINGGNTQASDSETVGHSQTTESTEESGHFHAKIFVGMTREQATAIGGETLEVFNSLVTEGDVVTKAIFQKYHNAHIRAITPELKERFKNFDPNNKEDMAFLKDLIKSEVDMEQAIPGEENMTAKDVLKGMLKDVPQSLLEEFGVTKENYQNNRKKFGEGLYKALQYKCKEELSNKEGDAYREQYERLKRGDYTEFEREHLGLQGELTDDQLEQYTQIAIKNRYAATIVNLNINTAESEDDNGIAALVQGFSAAILSEKPELKSYLVSLGLFSIKDQELQTETANMVAADAKAYGLDEDCEASNTLLAKSILETASESGIENFINSNPEYKDLIREVANAIITNTNDSSRKTILETTVGRTIGLTSDGSGSGGISASGIGSGYSGSNIPTGGDVGGYSSALNYLNTSQTDDNSTQIQIRTDSNSPTGTAYSTNPIQQNSNALTQKEVQELERLSSKIGIKMALNNMSIGDALSEIISHFDQVSDADRMDIIAYFSSAQPFRLCEAYIDGSEELQKFMDERHYMSDNLLYMYFQRKPEALHRAPKNIQDKYYEIEANINRPYTQDNNTDNLRTIII